MPLPESSLHLHPAGLPCYRPTSFSLRAEQLLSLAGSAMARGWPFAVSLVYADCFWGILIGRGGHGFGQIFWHFVAIALTLLLAALGSRQTVGICLHERPQAGRAGIEFITSTAALGLMAGLLAFAGLDPAVQPMPLHWLVLGLACACILLFALACAARVSLLATDMKQASPPHFASGRFK